MHLEECTKYYSVSVDRGTEEPPSVTVFSNRKEALELMKECKGARLKVFSSLEEANQFVPHSPKSLTNDDGQSAEVPVAAAAEKPSPFPEPTRQEIVKLRKAIQCGDTDYFRRAVWSNPRYLISSIDVPVILHTGSRYNAMHVAAQENRPEMARLVLDAVEDSQLMGSLYPDNNETSRQNRMSYLIDLYLNMPNKVSLETPLHVAARYGAADVVKILTSYPICERGMKDSCGRTPQDVVCIDFFRKCDSEDHEKRDILKTKILSYLQDQYFVPILRTEDDSLPPCVGEPWSPQKQIFPQMPSFVHPRLTEKPYALSAFAGPMTPSQAREFHKMLKTTPRCLLNNGSPGFSAELRLSDYEKGLECIARKLATQIKVKWQEWWHFLDTYSDLSQLDGLETLEKYLERRKNKCLLNEYEHDDSGDSFTTASDDAEQLDISNVSSGMSSLCQAFTNINLDDDYSGMSSPDSRSPVFSKPSISERCNWKNDIDSKDGMVHVIDQTCVVVANLIAMEMTKVAENSNFSKNLTHIFLQPAKLFIDIIAHMQKNGLPDDYSLESIHSKVVSELREKLQEDSEIARTCFEKTGWCPSSPGSSDEECDGAHWNVPRVKKRLFFHSIVQQHADCLVNLLQSRFSGQCDKDVQCQCLWSIDNEDESPLDKTDYVNDSLTECESIDGSLSNDGYATANSTLSERSEIEEDDNDPIFMIGSEPTKTDLDILRVIEKVDVDPVQFPLVHHWKRLVESFPQKQVLSWPSPRKFDQGRILPRQFRPSSLGASP